MSNGHKEVYEPGNGRIVPAKENVEYITGWGILNPKRGNGGMVDALVSNTSPERGVSSSLTCRTTFNEGWLGWYKLLIEVPTIEEK